MPAILFNIKYKSMMTEQSEESNIEMTEQSEECNIEMTEQSKESNIEMTEQSEESNIEITEQSEECNIEMTEQTEESNIEMTEQNSVPSQNKKISKWKYCLSFIESFFAELHVGKNCINKEKIRKFVLGMLSFLLIMTLIMIFLTMTTIQFAVGFIIGDNNTCDSSFISIKTWTIISSIVSAFMTVILSFFMYKYFKMCITDCRNFYSLLYNKKRNDNSAAILLIFGTLWGFIGGIMYFRDCRNFEPYDVNKLTETNVLFDLLFYGVFVFIV